jgi:hypothetical protein
MFCAVVAGKESNRVAMFFFSRSSQTNGGRYECTAPCSRLNVAKRLKLSQVWPNTLGRSGTAACATFRLRHLSHQLHRLSPWQFPFQTAPVAIGNARSGPSRYRATSVPAEILSNINGAMSTKRWRSAGMAPVDILVGAVRWKIPAEFSL